MWMNQHPLAVLNNDTIKATSTSNEAAEDYKTAIKHTMELFTFLSPIIPSVAESQRTIEIYRKEGHTENLKKQEEKKEEENTGAEQDYEPKRIEEYQENNDNEEEGVKFDRYI